MIETYSGSTRLLAAGELWRRYLTDPIRIICYLMTILVLGYGSRIDDGSPLIIPVLESIVGVAFTGIELVMLVILLLELIRRLVLRDFEMERSVAALPMIWIAIIMGAVPFVRMIIVEMGFRFPLELLEMPWLVGSFFLWLLVYRRQEIHAMLWMVMIAGLYKSFEGIVVYLRVGLGWGLLTGWRDAMLLSMMVLGAFFAFLIKPDGDKVYQRIRLFFFLLLPMSMFTFIGSTRRSYVLGVIAAMGLLIFYLDRKERRRVYLRGIPIVLLFSAGAMVALGSTQLIDRFVSVSDNPGTEGSGLYRVIEFYSVSQDVAERPLFGWQMGRAWTNRTLLDVEQVSNVVPHNTYLYVLWRSGIFGMLFWFWVMITMFRMHHRTIRAARTPFIRFLAIWLASGTIAVSTAGIAMSITADRLKNFYPFIMVMTSFLPGAWPPRKPFRTRLRSPEMP